MKAQILKIAGVKSEKEFYKKYPSEAAFMKQHGKAFKKAQTSSVISKAANGLDIPDWYQDAMSTTTDTTTLSPIGNSGAFDINKFGISPQTLGKTTTPATTQAPGWTGSMFKTPGIPTQEYANQKQISGEGEIQRAYDSSKQAKPISQMNPAAAVPILGGVIGGIIDINAAKEANLYKQQTGLTLDLQNLALNQRPNVEEHYYDSPEQNVTDANTLSPLRGSGSNVITRNGGKFIKAEDGTSIGGNPTEIQNTYGIGNSLYDDLGYAPLGESDMSDEDIVKQYRSGGFVPRAFEGFDMTSGIQGVASGGQTSGGSKIGNAVGGAFGGPWGMVGSFVGGALDTTGAKGEALDRANQQKMAGIQNSIMGKSLGQQYGANRKNGGDIYSYEEGGYMNPEYNPQLITMFGDHNAEDFADYVHKDEFRSGGHLTGDYTQPSARALETMALGGELKTTWGGVAKPISYNPFMDGTGETVNFYGQKHSETDGKGNSGIGVIYGNGGETEQYAGQGAEVKAHVEVEAGEPGWESIDPKTGQKHFNVLGNLELNKNSIGQIEDEEVSDLIDKYNGQKFKNIAKTISNQENKQMKVVETAIKNINSLKPKTQIDKTTKNAFAMMEKSGVDKLKGYAGEKENLVALQSTLNEIADEQGGDADYLARKGELKPLKQDGSRKARLGASIMQAKNGTKIPIAQAGYTSKYGITPWTGNVQKGNKYGKATASGFSAEQWDEVADKLGFKGKGNKEFQEFLMTDKRSAPLIKARHQNLYGKDPWVDPEHFGYGWAANELLLPKAAEIPADTTTGISTTAKPVTPVEPNKRKWWMDAVNQVIPYLRTDDTEALDPNQLAGEYYALANNQLEPVQAQGFQPQLGTPYDISLQDQLNANQADFRSIQKMTGYNPAAQANLAAQKYAANSKVLGEQFRMNQAEKDKVYDQNRQILNQAKLQNLAIYDKQYERQAQAKSNTKATTQAALSSISDKFAKNKLENRTLKTYENMYNYRFNKDFKAINQNPLAQFDTTVTGAGSPTGKSTDLSEYERAKAISNAYESKVKKDIKDIPVERNGGIVREFKNL